MKQKQLPQGFRDEFGNLAQQKENIARCLLAGFRQRGYVRINTPLMEYKDVFSEFALGEHQGIYEFVDTAKGNLVLRPDLTLPIARFLSTTPITLPKKFYYYGDVIAFNQEHRGAANQVTQAGVELVGYSSLKAELECLWIIADVNKRLLKNQLHIELSDVRFADAICDSLALDAQSRQDLLEALFNKNFPRYEGLIKQYEGNALYPLLVCWPRLFGTVQEVQEELKRVILPVPAQRVVEGLVDLAKSVETIDGQHIRLDLSSRAPQDYYTGITFKGYVDTVSSYLVSGGRYDQLLANFQEQPECAVGMAFDVDALTGLTDLADMVRTKGLLFYTEDQWPQAVKILSKETQLGAALSDSLKGAREEAHNQGLDLYVLTEEGVSLDA